MHQPDKHGIKQLLSWHERLPKNGEGGTPPVRKVPERDGDKHQARQRITQLVNAGVMRPASAHPCTDCGEWWQPSGHGGFHEYDHHNGYGVGRHEDVIPLCKSCHGKRTTQRGERKNGWIAAQERARAALTPGAAA